jgi:hypothetical protein
MGHFLPHIVTPDFQPVPAFGFISLANFMADAGRPTKLDGVPVVGEGVETGDDLCRRRSAVSVSVETGDGDGDAAGGSLGSVHTSQ